MAVDDELRIRLEGGAELLEATVPRYRALVRALGAFAWRDKVRRSVEVLAAAVAQQQAVDDVLALVQRRAASEGWPEGPVLAAAREVRALRTKLREQVEHLRGEACARDLAVDLAALEAEARTAPRFVRPAERWPLAVELIPADLPAVVHMSQFGALAERLFATSPTLEALPGAEDFARFRHLWREGLQVLPELWKRLERVDRTGGVVRSLRRRAQRVPRFTAGEEGTGPAVLVHAEYWHGVSLARMKQLVVDCIEPVQPRTEEVLRVFGWMLERQQDPEAPLELETAGARRPRLALLELAARLRGGAGVARTSRPFDRLIGLATEADADQVDDDWRRLRDSLALVVRAARLSSNLLPPIYRSPDAPVSSLLSDVTLTGLIGQLEQSFRR